MKSFWMIGIAAVSALGLAAQTNSYTQINLDSDISGLATGTDAKLINPWGLSRPASATAKEDHWWAADQVTGVSTLYDANGAVLPLTVTIPTASGTGVGSPTGTAFIALNFVFSTLDGTISEWVASIGNKNVPKGFVHQNAENCVSCHTTQASLKVNHASAHAVYTGITVATNGSVQDIYVANAAGGIEVYDANFNPVTLAPGAFVDSNVPAGYTPFNIQAVGKRIYVTYSPAPPATGGYVVAYNAAGTRLLTLKNGSWFNEPWGIAQAPANFGLFSSALLVGNNGNGTILAFNPSTGAYLGTLEDSTGKAIVNSGLWGLSFGSGSTQSGPTNVLYFNAGIQNEQHGLFGAISAN
jgi:uncharacterized protein (TIGR03118 family)